jgi:hypothetical protein
MFGSGRRFVEHYFITNLQRLFDHKMVRKRICEPFFGGQGIARPTHGS